MVKGEILYGRKGSDAIHPIIYLYAKDEDSFVGCMLTSSKLYPDNLLMEESHFEKSNDDGVTYEFQFKNTHLVQAKLIKRNSWLPFRKIGQLTKEGIVFVDSEVKDKPPIFWEDKK